MPPAAGPGSRGRARSRLAGGRPIVDPTLLGYFTLMENVGPRSGFVIVEAVGPRPLYHCAAPPELSAGCRGAPRRGTRLPRSGSKSLGRRSTDCRPDLARLFYTDGFTLMENVGPRSGFVIVEAVGPRPLYHCAAPPELSAGCRGAPRRGTRLPRSGSKSLGRRSTDCRPDLARLFYLMENVGPRSGFVIVEAVGPRPLYHCAAPPELSAGCRGAPRRGTRLPRSGSKSLGRRSTDCRPDLARLFYTDGKRRPEVGLRYSGSGRPPAVVPLRSAARALCGVPRRPPPRQKASGVGVEALDAHRVDPPGWVARLSVATVRGNRRWERSRSIHGGGLHGYRASLWEVV